MDANTSVAVARTFIKEALRPLQAPQHPAVQRFGFILLPQFALMSMASAIEPLRAANTLAGRSLYQWHTFVLSGNHARASCGAEMAGDGLDDLHQSTRPMDTVFVCTGGNPADWRYPDLAVHLQRLAQNGVRLGGISGGAFVLAQSRLLAGRRFTLHWEYASALQEAFPLLSPETARYVLDRDRITCGGGVAAIDMMHALISQRHGSAFARRVTDWFLHRQVEEPQAPQRASTAQRFQVHHPALVAVLEKMLATVGEPLSRAAMALHAGVSPRQIDRLFARHLNLSFQQQYRQIRLAHARLLLQQSALPVTQVAIACGYASATHFSRSYRGHFGQTPRQARGNPGIDCADDRTDGCLNA